MGRIRHCAGFRLLVHHSTRLHAYTASLASGALGLIGAASLAAGRPFTLGVAKRSTPREAWDNPLFIQVNMIISGVDRRLLDRLYRAGTVRRRLAARALQRPGCSIRHPYGVHGPLSRPRLRPGQGRLFAREPFRRLTTQRQFYALPGARSTLVPQWIPPK